MNSDIFKLSICQALFISSMSIMITSSAIIGASLADQVQYATLGVGMTFFAMMICSYPMSILMGRIGRRRGFISALCVTLLGSVLISFSISIESFGFYCFSAFVMGCGMSSGQYLRFAAVEVAGKLYKGKAISYVLAGGIIAAFTGPNLARLTRDWISVEFTGSYLCMAIIFLLIIIVMSTVKFPARDKQDQIQATTPLSNIIVRPIFLVAVISALVAYASMNLIMTATPLSMHQHGHEFSKAALVIQWHLLGMFVPSLFTGTLIEKLGLIPMMMAGCVILMVCTLCNLAGTQYGHYALALILLGVGWNFLFVGATQLLTSAYCEAEKSRTQGLNDFLVALSVATTALSSGWILSQLGWTVMNIMVLVAVIIVLAILVIYYFFADTTKSYAAHS